MTQLESLLDDAADALISGNILALEQLTPLIEALEPRASDQTNAETLRKKAERNVRLLEAAARGVRAARLRMIEITSGSTLTTYDPRGQKSLIASKGKEPIRRA